MTLPLLECGPSLRGWSHQESILVCPYKWARTYLDADTVRVPSEPLVKGSLVHMGLAHYWTQRMGQHGYEDPVTAVHRLAADEDRDLATHIGFSEAWRKHAPLAATAVQRYCAEQPLGHLKSIAVEYHVAMYVDVVDGVARLVEPPTEVKERREYLARTKQWRRFYLEGAPWLTTFRADAIVQLPNGLFAIVDHKTGYKLDERKIAGFRASGQMLQYQLWGSLAYGKQWGGVHIGFVNMTEIQRGGKRPFSSFAVTSRPDAVAMFPQAVVDRCELVKGLIERDAIGATWPRAFREQGPCSDRYGTCDHFDSCVGSGV